MPPPPHFILMHAMQVTPDGYRPQSPWLRGQTQCTQEAAGGVSAVKNIRCYSSARYVLPGGSSADVKAEFKAAFGTELPCLDQEVFPFIALTPFFPLHSAQCVRWQGLCR